MKRRELLGFAGIAGSSALAGLLSGRSISAFESIPKVQQTADALSALARRSGRLYGCAVRAGALIADPGYRQLVLGQADLLVPEGELKWSNVAPTAETLDFKRANIIARIAAQNNRRLRGHTLCWHKSVPGWFPSLSDQPALAKALYEKYVSTSVKTWGGIVTQWDVANEILSTDQESTLRDSALQRLYGDRLLDVVFGLAREQDSESELFYNDFGFEQEATAIRKRSNLLHLLSGLKARNVPIDGVGLQTHLYMSSGFDADAYGRFLDEIGAMGLKVMITELDVDDHVINASFFDRSKATAAIVKDLLNVAFSKPFVKGLCTWGITTRYSWLNDYGDAYRQDLQPMASLPYNADLSRNALHDVIAAAFLNASPYREIKR